MVKFVGGIYTPANTIVLKMEKVNISQTSEKSCGVMLKTCSSLDYTCSTHQGSQNDCKSQGHSRAGGILELRQGVIAMFKAKVSVKIIQD